MTQNNEVTDTYIAAMRVEILRHGRTPKQFGIDVCERIYGSDCFDFYHTPWISRPDTIFPRSEFGETFELADPAFLPHDLNLELVQPQIYIMVKLLIQKGNNAVYIPNHKPCAGWGLVSRNQKLADFYFTWKALEELLSTGESISNILDKDQFHQRLEKAGELIQESTPGLIKRIIPKIESKL
jgi:hypothetical protein